LSISSPNIDRFSNFLIGLFCGTFVINCILNIPPHLKCVIASLHYFVKYKFQKNHYCNQCYRFVICLSVSLSVCLSVCLSRSCIVFKRQKISTQIFLAYDRPMSPDSVKIWLHQLATSFPKFAPKWRRCRLLPNHFGPCFTSREREIFQESGRLAHLVCGSCYSATWHTQLQREHTDSALCRAVQTSICQLQQYHSLTSTK